MEFRYKKLAQLATACFGAVTYSSIAIASGGHHGSSVEFPKALSSYHDAAPGLVETLSSRIAENPFNLTALIIFLLAIFHTFLAAPIASLSHKIEHDFKEKNPNTNDVSFTAALLHYLGEVEAIFGIWALVLMGAISYYFDWHTAVDYVSHKVNYTEPLFIVVVMTMAATKPVLDFAETILKKFAQIGSESVAAWWICILVLAPLMGSFITEPAAMTIGALLLSRQFYRYNPSTQFKYGTLGLLFVNVSVGGTLTNFAAPPVLMVATPWKWSTSFMLANFGWKAVIGILISTAVYFLFFFKSFAELEAQRLKVQKNGSNNLSSDKVPFWITAVHLIFMFWTVFNAHYPPLFIGGFLFFIAFMTTTPQHQNQLELKSAILVGFFLAGLVIHGGVQGWWIAPVLSSLAEVPLMLAATTLTAFNDNAAITYLSTLVPGFSETLKYAVVAGAVTGGGLTVIANAPNPAGQAILAKFFPGEKVSPAKLFLSALVPTIILGISFMVL